MVSPQKQTQHKQFQDEELVIYAGGSLIPRLLPYLIRGYAGRQLVKALDYGSKDPGFQSH